MGTLNVSSYRVGTNRSRADPGAHRYYLSLQGTSEEGAATGAIVYFWPDPPTDTVGHLADTLLVGLPPDEDFAGWYDILRAERPVKVFYVEGGQVEPYFTSVSAPTRRLWVRARATSIPDQD